MGFDSTVENIIKWSLGNFKTKWSGSSLIFMHHEEDLSKNTSERKVETTQWNSY